MPVIDRTKVLSNSLRLDLYTIELSDLGLALSTLGRKVSAQE